MQVGPLGTNCYLLEDETHQRRGGNRPRRGRGADPEAQLLADGAELKLILLTHAHFDHTGGVAELHAALPDVPVFLHPADAARLGSQVFPPIGAPTVPYGDGDVVKLGDLDIQVLHTPGHTPGGVCLLVGDALFTGDTLFQGSMGRTDFAGGSYEDIMASLKPGWPTCPATTASSPATWAPPPWRRERKTNYYIREALRG